MSVRGGEIKGGPGEAYMGRRKPEEQKARVAEMMKGGDTPRIQQSAEEMKQMEGEKKKRRASKRWGRSENGS